MGERMKPKTRKEFEDKAKRTEITTKEGKDFLKKYTVKKSLIVRTSHLKRYLAYRDMDCAALIDEVAEDWKRDRRDRGFVVELQIMEFQKWLKDVGFSSHYISNLLGCVRAFYKFSNFPLNSDRLLIESGVSMAKNHVKLFTLEDVKNLYNSTTSRRNKAILLFLLQSGQGAGELSKLNYGDVRIDLEGEEYPLMVRISDRKGTGLSYCTFIGADAIHALGQYLNRRIDKLNEGEDRDKFLTKDGRLRSDAPLFAKRNGKTRISPPGIAEVLKYMVLNSDVVSKAEIEESDLNPMRPHAFRKFFKTTLTHKGVNRFLVEYLMGHAIKGVERAYFIDSKGGEAGLRKDYADFVEPWLSIETDSARVKAVVSPGYKESEREKLMEMMGEEWANKADTKAESESLRTKYAEVKYQLGEMRRDMDELVKTNIIESQIAMVEDRLEMWSLVRLTKTKAELKEEENAIDASKGTPETKARMIKSLRHVNRRGVAREKELKAELERLKTEKKKMEGSK